MFKKVSIIIPTYNEEKEIENCLNSLENQSFKEFEIIIVDDGSTDKTKEIVKKFKKVKLIEGEHRGTGFSRNLGAKKSEGDILVFVDADMRFNRDYLKNLIKPILDDSKIVGTTHDSEVANNLQNIWSKCWGKERITEYYRQNPTIFRAIRKDKFLEMNGFDPKYGYADDQTFWLKYKIRPVFAKNTLCYHNNPETLEETFKQAKWIGTSWKERFKIFRIWGLNYIVLGLFFVLLPFLVLYKAIKTSVENISLKEKVKFYWFKFYGYFIGIKKAVIKGEVWR